MSQQAQLTGPEPYLEPWMRGTHGDLDPLRRAVVHALELTREDAQRKLGTLRHDQLFAEPGGLPPVAFHLRHIVRSLDRLLTYAEGRMLSDAQLALLSNEHDPSDSAETIYAEFFDGVRHAIERIRGMAPESYDAPRGIGRKRLPTTVAGLLIHCAEHSQRHAGQMVSTARLVVGSGAEGTA